MNTAVDTQDPGSKAPLNLAEMSDEAVLNLDPDTLPEDPVETVDTKSTDDPEDQVTDDPEEPEDKGEQFPDLQDTYYASDNAEPSEGDPDPDLATAGGEKDTSPADDAEDQPEGTDYKAAYTDLMSPFKAAKREVRLSNPEDARRLMQMGVDYSRKMEAMKPHQKVLKTLEKNGLLDPEKINFLIDLDKKDPAAMKKFFKDSELEPHELNYEDDDPSYKPTDYAVGDAEIALEEALDSISDTEQYDRTIDIISNKMDESSRKALVDNPGIITLINDHIGVGIYDKITDIVKQERMFGRMQGMSDLEAYKTVGDAIDAKGGFGTNPDNPDDPKRGTSPDGRAQDFGQEPKRKAEALRRNRKRAASPTKGAVSKTKEASHNYLSEYTDKEIEEMGSSTL